MHWYLAPFGAVGITIVAMLLTSVVTLPLSAVLTAGGLYWGRQPSSAVVQGRLHRFLGGASIGLLALWAWMFAFERPGQRDVPMVVPAVALLVVLGVAQAYCCVAIIRRAGRARPAASVLAWLLLWAGLSNSALAYAMHRGAIPGSL